MGSKISKHELDELQKQFEMLDKNGDKFIDEAELTELTRKYMPPKIPQEFVGIICKAFMVMGDKNKDGKLSFKEYISLAKSVSSGKMPKEMEQALAKMMA